jgi:hypothetical protein
VARAGPVSVVVPGHAMKNPHPHPKAEAMLNLVLENGTAQVPLNPEPQSGEAEGQTGVTN